MDPDPGCWLSGQVQARPSGISGLGLFAMSDIADGVVVSRLGGRMVSNSALRQMLQSAGDTYVDTVSIFEDANLVLLSIPPTTAGITVVSQTSGGSTRSRWRPARTSWLVQN
jgi:hypothetical protein